MIALLIAMFLHTAPGHAYGYNHHHPPVCEVWEGQIVCGLHIAPPVPSPFKHD